MLLVGCTSTVPAPAADALDLTVPRGVTDAPLLAGPELRISADAVFVAGRQQVTLVGGRVAVSEFAGQSATVVRDALAAEADRGRKQAAEAGHTWDERVVVLADHATPFFTFIDALFTARLSGFGSYDLVVTDGRVRHRHPLSPPLEWFPLDPDIKRERPLNPVFTVRPDGVSVSLGGWSERRFGLAAACPPAPNGCYDYAAIGAYAAELKAMVPNEVVATFRVDGAVPLQAVVTLIDAVGGVDCRISRALAGERVPDECLFWQAIVNLDPPLRLADVAAP